LSDHALVAVRERGIRAEWLQYALSHPRVTMPDRDDPGLRHALAPIEEFGGRVLRVVYNPAVSPPRIITAYFDRSMRGKL